MDITSTGETRQSSPSERHFFTWRYSEGAPFSMYTLVLADRPVGDRVLRLLHRIGQAAPPETADHVTATISDQLHIE
jgi:hypothetical protein